MSTDVDRTLILGAYKTAEKRILFLDYDGTLVPFRDLPGDSVLGKQTHNIIKRLTEDPKNSIYIISGRDKNFLTDRFFGINTGLIAEHGFLFKEKNGEWECIADIDKTWKKSARSLLQEFTVLFPGSFIEEKESSVAYHFRTAAGDVGEKVRHGIRKKFLILQKKYPGLELLDGDKVVEVKPGSFNKGRIASTIIRNEDFDFVFAAGDDLTDEHLFASLNKDSFTIKIGQEPTCARYHISSQKQFIEFLEGFNGEW